MGALENPEGPWGDKIVELFEAVDSYIPEPERANDKPFLIRLLLRIPGLRRPSVLLL